MRAIEKLSNDPHNVVVVITGLTKQKLGKNDEFFLFLHSCSICFTKKLCWAFFGIDANNFRSKFTITITRTVHFSPSQATPLRVCATSLWPPPTAWCTAGGRTCCPRRITSAQCCTAWPWRQRLRQQSRRRTKGKENCSLFICLLFRQDPLFLFHVSF